MNDRLNSCESNLREVASKLTALNPLAVLARGYSVTYLKGTPVSSVSDLSEGDLIRIKFKDGSADCRVEKTVLEEFK